MTDVSPGQPDRADRWWTWLWVVCVLAVILLCAPSVYHIVRLRSARAEGDLPRALQAAESLSDGFFGPLFSSWLDENVRQMRAEVISENLMSIKRLVPDSEESAYAEMELGRLALTRGDPRQAVVHLERYLKSGLGRDVVRARMDLSDAYRELKKFDPAATLLQAILKGTMTSEERMEASFRLGELYQFYLNRVPDAVEVYRLALEDTTVQGRWRNDIMTNLSLLRD